MAVGFGLLAAAYLAMAVAAFAEGGILGLAFGGLLSACVLMWVDAARGVNR